MPGKRIDQSTNQLEEIGGEFLDGSGFEDQSPDSEFAIEDPEAEQSRLFLREEGEHVD